MKWNIFTANEDISADELSDVPLGLDDDEDSVL